MITSPVTGFFISSAITLPRTLSDKLTKIFPPSIISERVKEFLDPSEPFLFTYGDGLSNVDIDALVKFHESHGKLATVTAVNPPGRFGMLTINKNEEVVNFNEKPQHDSTWINGGFFVFEPELFDYLHSGDSTILEKTPLETLAKEQRLMAFKHTGFWHPMDTLRDKKYLNEIYKKKKLSWLK